MQAPSPSRALAMASFALQEHEAFGGQSMDAEGRMTEAGDSEAEDTRRTVPGLAPWQRVLGYWQAVDPQSPVARSLRRTAGRRPAPADAGVERGDGRAPAGHGRRPRRGA
ncbi:hypothetical protein [Variovorax sp. YR566]|uniref:hypothetical protein n=1 Tax=Variovorax sp. YR566 TaxID=3450237 RepID=UPI003F81FC98